MITGTATRPMGRSHGSDSDSDSSSDTVVASSSETSAEKPRVRQWSHFSGQRSKHADLARGDSCNQANVARSESSESNESSENGEISASRESSASDEFPETSSAIVSAPADPYRAPGSGRRRHEQSAVIALKSVSGPRTSLLASRRRQFAEKKPQGRERLDLSRVSVSTLSLAIRNNNVSMAETLITREMENNPGWKSWLGFYLLLALERGRNEIAMLLLERGADVQKRDGAEFAPLHAACCTGNVEMAEALIRAGADVNVCDMAWSTPLLFACAEGHLPIVRLLLKNKASMEQSNFVRRTPLYEAAFCGHAGIVKVLLRHGAMVMDPTHNLISATHGAIAGNHFHILRLLLEHDGEYAVHAGCAFTEADGMTAIAFAVARNNIDMRIVDYLSRYTIPSQATIKFQKNYPLALAICSKMPQAAMRLIELGWDANYSKDGSVPPLVVASGRGKIEILKTLLGLPGLDLDITTATGKTALTTAVLGNHYAAVELLICAGADLHLADARQKTPLVYALENGCASAIVDLLLHALPQVDPDLPGKFFSTALQMEAARFLDSLVRATDDAGGRGGQGHRRNAEEVFRVKTRKFIARLCMEYRISHVAATALASNLRRIVDCWRRFGGTADIEVRQAASKQMDTLLMHAMSCKGSLQELVAAPEKIDELLLTAAQRSQQQSAPGPDARLKATALMHCRAIMNAGTAARVQGMERLLLWLPTSNGCSSAEFGSFLRQQIGLHEEVARVLSRAWERVPRNYFQLRLLADNFLEGLDDQRLTQAIAGMDEVEFELVDAQLTLLRQRLEALPR